MLLYIESDIAGHHSHEPGGLSIAGGCQDTRMDFGMFSGGICGRFLRFFAKYQGRYIYEIQLLKTLAAFDKRKVCRVFFDLRQ